jgi:hypothetical protein
MKKSIISIPITEHSNSSRLDSWRPIVHADNACLSGQTVTKKAPF